MPRRDAKKYSSSLRAFPSTKEVRKEERREAGQEGIEMERVELPAWEKYKTRREEKNIDMRRKGWKWLGTGKELLLVSSKQERNRNKGELPV